MADNCQGNEKIFNHEKDKNIYPHLKSPIYICIVKRIITINKLNTRNVAALLYFYIWLNYITILKIKIITALVIC